MEFEFGNGIWGKAVNITKSLYVMICNYGLEEDLFIDNQGWQ